VNHDRPAGVTRHYRRYPARVWFGRRYVYLGLYPTEWEAVRAAAEARVILRGHDAYRVHTSGVPIGRRVVVWRCARRLSFFDLAAKPGLSAVALAAIQSGFRPPSCGELEALAAALAITVSRLAGGYPPGVPE
jgi:hypothetical protein